MERKNKENQSQKKRAKRTSSGTRQITEEHRRTISFDMVATKIPLRRKQNLKTCKRFFVVWGLLLTDRFPFKPHPCKLSSGFWRWQLFRGEVESCHFFVTYFDRLSKAERRLTQPEHSGKQTLFRNRHHTATKASVPRAFFSDSFESSIVMAPLLASKLTTVPSCEAKTNRQGESSGGEEGALTATVKWSAGGMGWSWNKSYHTQKPK